MAEQRKWLEEVRLKRVRPIQYSYKFRDQPDTATIHKVSTCIAKVGHSWNTVRLVGGTLSIAQTRHLIGMALRTYASVIEAALQVSAYQTSPAFSERTPQTAIVANRFATDQSLGVPAVRARLKFNRNADTYALTLSFA